LRQIKSGAAELRFAKGATVSLAGNSFTYSGHYFSGWATASDAMTATYNDAGDYTMGSTDVNLEAWLNTAFVFP